MVAYDGVQSGAPKIMFADFAHYNVSYIYINNVIIMFCDIPVAIICNHDTDYI